MIVNYNHRVSTVTDSQGTREENTLVVSVRDAVVGIARAFAGKWEVSKTLSDGSVQYVGQFNTVEEIKNYFNASFQECVQS